MSKAGVPARAVLCEAIQRFAASASWPRVGGQRLVDLDQRDSPLPRRCTSPEMFDTCLHGGDRLRIKVQNLGEFGMGQAQLLARSQGAPGQDLVTRHTPALACSPPFVPVYPRFGSGECLPERMRNAR